MKRPRSAFDSIIQWMYKIATSTNLKVGKSVLVITLIILIAWLITVVYTTTNHEFFRDEVRAWSLAKNAETPLDLYTLTKYDGHPVVWFLILYAGTLISDSPIVLPIVSIIIALAAVSIFMFYAPFQLWMRSLFIFGALPLYEYSVMARNYGISMLFIFLVAALYKQRNKMPLTLAFILALLSNTNVFAAIIASLIACIWLWEVITDKQLGLPVPKKGKVIAASMIFIIGLLICYIFIMPRDNSILTSEGLPMNVKNFLFAIYDSVLRPDKTFTNFLPIWISPFFAILILYLCIFGLIRNPKLFLAALIAQFMTGVLFRMLGVSSFRHQGLYFIFLMMLYWLILESGPNEKKSPLKQYTMIAGLYIATLFLLLTSVAKAKSLVLKDIKYEISSGKSFGGFLTNSLRYHDAIIVSEPDFVMETLLYYASNRIYFPRENRFGNTVMWTTDSENFMSLGGLLEHAREIKKQNEQPVLILIGHVEFSDVISGDIDYPYLKKFSWNSEQMAEFNNSTTFVKDFSTAKNDENYRIFELK